MTLQPDQWNLSQTVAASKIWISERKHFTCTEPLRSFLAASHSPSETQHYVKSLLWTRHKRISSIFCVSPNRGLKAHTRAALASNTERVLASENLMEISMGTLFLGCQGITASMQATWGHFKHSLVSSGIRDLQRQDFDDLMVHPILDSNCWYSFSVTWP